MAYGHKTAADVAHSWAHQLKNSWSKGAVFYEGKIIFSYGHHFPMAVLLDDNHVAISTASYSNTTSKHQTAVKQAVSHMTKIYCPRLPDSQHYTTFPHETNIRWWKDLVIGFLCKMERSTRKSIWMAKIEETRTEARIYIDYFKVKVPKADLKFIFDTDIEGYHEGVVKARKAKERKEKAAIKMGKELHPVWLAAWRNNFESDYGKTLSLVQKEAIKAVERDYGYTRLRLSSSKLHVETTKDVLIPIDVAHKYYKKYLAVVAAGGCDQSNCNYKMLDFNVHSMSAGMLVVGCHSILREEIDYIAKELGWVKEKQTA